MSCLNRFFLPHTLCVTCPEVPGCHLLREMSSQWGAQKLLQGLVSYELIAYLSVFDIILTQLIMAILWKGCKPNNFESRNSQKISFTNIQGLRFFVECESFLKSNSPDILALCETNLDDSIDSGNFSVTSHLPSDCMIFLSPFLDFTVMSMSMSMFLYLHS